MRVVIDNVSFSYPTPEGSVVVLRSFAVDIAAGSMHAVVGPSGCGKTTLLRLIAGVERPTDGTIQLLGTPRFGHRTAMVFESPRLIPWWTVERNIGIGLEFGGRPKAIRDRVRDLYSSHVGLGGLGKRWPDQLSLGQQTRAGLGRGLAHEADVLLLDEPFAHLDAISRRRLSAETERMWMADGRTAVIVTHDVEEAVLLSDRVTVMRGGPGPALETIEVDAGRPRRDLEHPGLRSAVGRVWDALERAARDEGSHG